MALRTQYTWSIASLTVPNGETVNREVVFPVDPLASRPAGYISVGTHGGTGNMDVKVEHGWSDPAFMGLSNTSHCFNFTQITSGSVCQIAWRAASLDHQALAPYGKIALRAISTSGANTWDNILIKFLADVTN